MTTHSPTSFEAAAKTTPPAEADVPQPKPVRWRVVASIAAPLIVLNTGWVANSEMRAGVTEMTISTLFLGVTFLLFVLTLLNLVVRRQWGPKAALNQPELMALYSLLSMSSVVAGVGNYGFITPFLANPFYYDTPQNGWQSWWHLLPAAIGPRNPRVLQGFYEGHSTFFQPQIIAAWTPHLVYWSVFFLILLWMTLCLATILRRRWADEEHLPFPVLALPLEMTREGAPLYRNRLLWLGFAIPCFFHSLNSLQSIFPTLPSMQINTVHDLVAVAGLQYPWNGIGSLFYQLHPAGVGFGYLVNTDVSFSLWFFYLVKKAANVWGVTEGWRQPDVGWVVDSDGQFPYISYQAWGAWLALSFSALWAGRGFFRAYLRHAWAGENRAQVAGEPMSARMAVGGFLLGFLVLCGFVWAWGGSWWLPVVFLILYLLLMVTLTRIRAEAAVLSTELMWVDPQSILTGVYGTINVSHTDLVHTATLSWFNLDYRAAGMPHELEALVGQERSHAHLRPIIPALLLAAAFAMAAALLWDLQLYYVHGAATGNVNGWRITKGSEAWNALQIWLQSPTPPLPHAWAGMVFGAGLTWTIAALRARFTGFPFNPAAYALNMSFANDFFWGDMFVAWLIKALILRYGGMKVYRAAMPFFLGLILGDFVVGAAWSIVGTVFHVNLFRTFAI